MKSHLYIDLKHLKSFSHVLNSRNKLKDWAMKHNIQWRYKSLREQKCWVGNYVRGWTNNSSAAFVFEESAAIWTVWMHCFSNQLKMEWKKKAMEKYWPGAKVCSVAFFAAPWEEDNRYPRMKWLVMVQLWMKTPVHVCAIYHMNQKTGWYLQYGTQHSYTVHLHCLDWMLTFHHFQNYILSTKTAVPP